MTKTATTLDIKKKPSELLQSSKSENPFTPHPSSGSLAHKPSGTISGGGVTREKVEERMKELDSILNMPEAVEVAQWERFVAYRHRKVESEMKVSQLYVPSGTSQ